MTDSLRDQLRVPVNQDFDLSSVDPSATPGLLRVEHTRPKTLARQWLIAIGEDLAKLQEQLYAQAKVGDSHRRVLLVLQAMDCGGKDGTIRRRWPGR